MSTNSQERRGISCFDKLDHQDLPRFPRRPYPAGAPAPTGPMCPGMKGASRVCELEPYEPEAYCRPASRDPGYDVLVTQTGIVLTLARSPGAFRRSQATSVLDGSP
jgi:hypothetical protein